MKKLGTPIATGPGVAKEKVGFAGVGAPPGVFVAGALGFAAPGLPGFFAPGVFGLPFLEPGFVDFLVFGFDGDEGLFGVVGVLGVVLVGGVGVVCDGVEVVVGVVVVGVVVVDELDGDGHDSLTFWTGPGRFRDDTGAPGGSWKVRTCPVRRVTVTVQSAADALGSAAIAGTARAVRADAKATLSFRRFNTVALFPPALPSAATVPAPREQGWRGSSY